MSIEKAKSASFRTATTVLGRHVDNAGQDPNEYDTVPLAVSVIFTVRVAYAGAARSAAKRPATPNTLKLWLRMSLPPI